MTLTLLMPWFPIILAVGVGGRMLGPRRGYALGIISALFWVVLVQATAGVGFWRNSWIVASVVLGAAAILFMGGWAGGYPPLPATRRNAVASEGSVATSSEPSALFPAGPALQRFDDWLEDHRDDLDPWAAFGEFVRGSLFECCSATHVRLYRLSNEAAELSPLHEPDGAIESKSLSARGGILGHVLTSGRAFLHGDPNQGALVEELARRSDPIPAWVFAVSRGSKRLGVVVVGQLNRASPRQVSILLTMEHMVSAFWRGLSDAIDCRKAGLDDPGSGMLNRDAFLKVASRSMRDSYACGEPVALAMIAVEGLRELNDSGRWVLADQVIREAADAIRKKIRHDDVLGRFDGSRFIWLLRRVDSELAELIAKQVMARLRVICEDESRWRTKIHVRCGVVGSGLEQPAAHDLICRALTQSRRARIEKLAIACEASDDRIAVGAGA